MRVILVRHGQTVFNRDSRYQGHADAELSDLGREQAELVAAHLERTRIDAVYSSDLSRASDTAGAIAARHGLPIFTNPALREVGFGDWEGLTVSEIQERYPDLYSNYRRDSITHRAPRGERLEDLQSRTVQAVDEIAQKHPDDSVVVVTHGGPIRAFFCHALDTGLESFRKIRLDNAGVTILSRKGSDDWTLEIFNDSCFTEIANVGQCAHDETLAEEKR